jgi:hypothetical protein
MTVKFRAVKSPSPELIREVASLNPLIPFFSEAYVRSMQASGFRPVALFTENSGMMLSGCTGYMRRGWLNNHLEITTLPELRGRKTFWKGLADFCRSQRISVLTVNTFASPEASIDQLEGETRRQQRMEFVLDLAEGDLSERVSSRHRRQIHKARRAGITVRCRTSAEACTEHARLTNLSLDRLRARGQEIDYRIDAEELLTLVRNDAADIFEATLNGEVLSSVMVVRSDDAAYLKTSATSDEGRRCGAGHFLYFEIAKHLQNAGFLTLNLGGASVDNIGLQEFKAEFGARRIDLEAAEFYIGGPIRKRVGAVARLRNGIAFLRHKGFVPIAMHLEGPALSAFGIVESGACIAASVGCM